MPQISNILQNLSNHVLVPEDNTVFLIVVRNNATVRFVLSRRENAAVIELLVDTHIAHTFATPQKNLLYDRCSLRVNNQLILIVWVFNVSVLFPCANEIAVFHLASQGRRYLARNILGIVIIDDIGKGYRQLTTCFYSICIKTIIDSNKTDTEKRTDFFKKLTGLNVVTSKSGKVFYYDAVNLFCLNCFHQLLPFRTVKVRSSVAIVNKGSCQLQIRTIAYILIEQCQLIFDGIRAIQIIFTRKTSVDSSLVNDSKLFRSNGLTG